MRIDAARSAKGRAVAALILLSFFWALDGLAPELFPALRRTALPAMERQMIAFALFAVAAAIYAVTRRRKWPTRQQGIAWAGIGILMFAVPLLLTFATLTWVSQFERVAIFSLTPVIAVVLEPHIGNSANRSNSAMMASLIAVAGMLAIFPLNVPFTLSATWAVIALVVAAASAAIGNCLAVRLAASQSEFSVASCAVYASGAATVAFAAASASAEITKVQFPNAIQILWLGAIDLPPLLLLVWLFKHMSAARMTTRFLIAPLLTVLTGIALEQPQITARMVIGVTLLAAGAAWLLIADDVDESATKISIV